MIMTKFLKTAALAALFGALLAPAAAATEPLLIPGKQALYQRVLAIPGARLSEAPGAATNADEVTPFTAFYVYARRNEAAQDWLQVGTDRHGGVAGWLPAKQSIPWNQGLTVAFREPIGHDRALLFDAAEAARGLAESRDMDRYQALYDAAVAGETPADSPVLAIQPPGRLDLREDFYLVPILQHQDLYVGSERARLLEVSSVPLQSPTDVDPDPAGSEQPAPESAGAAGEPNNGYRAGLVFAIDSTLSMGPYIDRTREAVMKIYDALGDAGLLGNVNFGL
ncbi:MAG: VWA domain-containing protein, partial [Chromatiaceae bacterium]